MDWFSKYAQQAASPAAGEAAESPANSGDPVTLTPFVSPGNGEDGSEGVFDGALVNATILKYVWQPMDAVPADAMKYMSEGGSDALGAFLLDLAVQNRLASFVSVVKSYTESGISQLVATNSKEGLAAFQKWYSDMAQYIGNKDPFGLSRDVTIIHELGVF
jgi:hypothetical protein